MLYIVFVLKSLFLGNWLVKYFLVLKNKKELKQEIKEN